MGQKVEIRLTAMCRSGHHAVVYWIAAQCLQDGWVTKYLDDRPDPADPFHGGSRWYQWEMLRELGGSEVLEPDRFGDRDLLIYSYEDKPLVKVLQHKVYLEKHDDLVGHSEKVFEVVVLRDAYNHLASRLKQSMDKMCGSGRVVREGQSIENFRCAVEEWKEYARLWEDEDEREDLVLVNFNAWFRDEEYREEISRLLSIPFNDAGLDWRAGLSFFDGGDRGQYGARQSKVLERWRSMRDHPWFSRVFEEDTELVEMNKRLFGMGNPFLPDRMDAGMGI